jgi:hypothetical protein
MTTDQLLQRARWGFLCAVAVGLLTLAGGLVGAVPTVALAGWHLLLVGLLGRGLADCTGAIVHTLRGDPPTKPKPKPQYSTANPPPTRRRSDA